MGQKVPFLNEKKERRAQDEVRGEKTTSNEDRSRAISTSQVPIRLTWNRAERALRVHLGLDGDDSFPLGAPALLALCLHLEDVGVVGQQVLHHHRVLARVGDGEAVHLSWDTRGRGTSAPCCRHKGRALDFS